VGGLANKKIIATLDGVFALKQKGVKDLFRLLDEIQKGVIK
jgi:hypothetical protein